MNPLTDTARRRIGMTMIGLITVLVLIARAINVSDGTVGLADIQSLALTAVFGAVAFFGVRVQPRNGLLWAIIWLGVIASIEDVASATARALTGFTVDDVLEGTVSASPSTIEPVAAVGFGLALWVWIPVTFILATHVAILFPSGRATSAPWRWLAIASGFVMVGVGFFVLSMTAPWVTTPYDELIATTDLATGTATTALIIISVIAVGGLLLRYRTSTGEERLQYRWVTWALAILVIYFLFFPLLASADVALPVGFVVFLNVAVAFGIAVTKYRLYDIDVVINRTVVFVVVAGFITAVYALVVVGVGRLVGGSSLWLAIAATAIVALAFEPVRDRAQRLANRLVYGKRASPYEVLSDLTGRLPGAEHDAGLLDRMAEQLAAGTGADRAQVWLAERDGLQLAASHPANGTVTRVPDLASVPGRVTAIEHDGTTLGALTVEKRSGESLTPTEHRLIEDLAGSAGLVVRKVRLDTELEATAQELAASRLRLVEAQDAERRRLERNLHDGAQQHVIGLKVKLALAGRLATDEGSARTAELLTQMSTDAQDAVDEIRALAQGIYPPLLESEGLGPALAALATAAPVPVTIDAAVGRSSPEVETAAYFCVSEATTNAIKHATPPIHIQVHATDGTLTFSVTDHGPGIAPTTATDGSGLTNMTDRIDALGGTLTVTSTPNGSTVRGRVPIRAAAAT